VHRLLDRQIRRSLGPDFEPDHDMDVFLDQVDRAYAQADADRAMLERALELSSGELVDTNRDLRQAVVLLEATLESTEDGLVVIDALGQVVRINQRFCVLWEVNENDMPTDGHELLQRIAETMVRPGDLMDLVRLANRDNQAAVSEVLELSRDRFLQVSSRPHTPVAVGEPGRVWSFHDLTEIKRAESTIRHFAYHDALTDLPNRALLHDRLSMAVAHARRSGSVLALFFIDLDRFKQINDTLGHSAGDTLLKEVAQRLSALMRSSDTLARFGGDEFVLVAQDIENRENAGVVAERLLAALRPSFHIDGHALHVSGSVGVALFPDDADDQESLVRKADAALYVAKDMGRDTFEVYRPERESVNLERLLMENELRAAVRGESLDIALQPIVCGTTGRVRAGEALCRWNRDGDPVPPATFIPVAEQAGLIEELGDLVLRKGLAQCRDWLDAGFGDVRVAINVSPLQLERGGFSRRLRDLLDIAGLPPHALEVEITESTLMKSGDRGVNVVHELAEIGLAVALDDFGTGYSSLQSLRQLPLTALKIDRSFVRACHIDARDAELIRTIVSLGHSLDLEVVAEGVENEEQCRLLVDAGCDLLQGYALGRPSDPEVFMRLLRAPVGLPTLLPGLV